METLRDQLDRFPSLPTQADSASGFLVRLLPSFIFHCPMCVLQDSGEVNVEDDRARLLRSPAQQQQQQQTFTVSSEAVEAESREAAMLDLQVL